MTKPADLHALVIGTPGGHDCIARMQTDADGIPDSIHKFAWTMSYPSTLE